MEAKNAGTLVGYFKWEEFVGIRATLFLANRGGET